MARRSAFENLHRKFEENPEGDVNVDIEVVVNADGDAAEDIIDAADVGEAEAVADQAVADEEVAQQESEDMQELAAVLRKHGLNAGMAAILEVLVPMDSYGIVMPAKESLDASGRNQDKADRLAAAFEASDEGFWKKTGNFFKQIWQWIKDQVTKLVDMMGRMHTKIKRTGETLDKREWATDRNKDKKIKVAKNPVKADDLKWVGTAVGSASTVYKALTDNDTESKVLETIKNSITTDMLNSIGMEWSKATEGSGDSIKNADNISIKEKNSNFFDTDEKEATQALLGEYKTAGQAYKDAVALCTFGRDLKALEKFTKQGIDFAESLNKNSDFFKGEDSKEAKSHKKKIGLVRSYTSALSKIIARTNKVILKNCGLYVSNGRVFLSVTKSEGSKVDYTDK